MVLGAKKYAGIGSRILVDKCAFVRLLHFLLGTQPDE